ncbi:MAG: hypothetical protein V4555_09895 [Acidobacteriota bacterium]
MHLQRPLLAALLSVTAAITLTGCSSSFDPIDAANPSQLSVGTVSGSTFGGRQPISGAHVYMFQTNTANYAGPGLAASVSNASVSLLKSAANTTSDGTNFYVTTAANGSFSITGDYNTCTAGSQVYLYATGGKPDGVNANTESGLLAVLGACGSYGSSTTVNMNEVSTIAAAYAMAGFATDVTHVGAPSATNTVAATGIANAFANANQLFDISSSPYNKPNTVARTSTPGSGTNGGTGTVPQQRIHTLANILSACINSTGTASSQCTTLFADMKSASGTTASDTAGIAIYMAQNSAALVGATSNLTAIYNLVVDSSAPYKPWDSSAAPNDLSLQLTFTGAGLLAAFNDLEDLVVDGSGSIWVTSGQGSTSGSYGTILSGFNHLGVPLNNGGYGSLGLSAPQGLAVDATSTYLYVTSYATDSLVKVRISDGNLMNTFSTGSSSGPFSIAIDSNGFPWVLLIGSDTAAKVDPSSGTITTTLSGNGLSGVEGIAMKSGSQGDIWISNAGGVGVSAFHYNGTAAGKEVDGAAEQWGSIAFDANNNAYSALINGNGVAKALGSSITSYSIYPVNFGNSDNELAIDGSNRVWLANNDFASAPTGTPQKNAVFLLAADGSKANGANGYQATPNTTEPDSIAVDASGNIWFNSQSDGGLHEIVGAATPVSVPLSYATANSKLGARP